MTRLSLQRPSKMFVLLCGSRRWRPQWRRHNTLHLASSLYVLLCLVDATLSFCPSRCQCNGGDGNSRANCIDAALDDVPIQLNPETKFINLTMNKIRTVEYTLRFYVRLEELDLSQNIIETLGSRNFEYQSEMHRLNLSRNLVSSLHKDAFRGLEHLAMLDLSYNRIEIVHPTAMVDLSSLLELDLTNNNIVSLEDNSFRNLASLEMLVFRNNQLVDVPANNLLHLHALKSLDLSYNLIEYVRNDSFVGVKDLATITMRGNVISDLDVNAFEGLATLKRMDVADNNLTTIPTQQLAKLSNLTYLSLSGNRFAHIPAVALLNLFHLKELHLNRLYRLTRIDSRAFVDNTYLQLLHLSRNPQLTDIPLRLFQGNPHILEVHMQANNLQTLYAAQFPIDRLQKLYLGDNPLQCNCSLLWLWRLVTGNYEDGSLGQGHDNAGAAVAALGGAKRSTNPGRNDGGDGDAAHIVVVGGDDNDNDAANDDADANDNVAIVGRHVASAAYSRDQRHARNDLLATNQMATSPLAGFLKLDIEDIGCDIWQDRKRTRRQLAAMSEGDITCPAQIVTIICAIFTALLVLMTIISIVFYLRFVKRRRKLLQDRGTLRSSKSIVNVHDRILSHQPLAAYPHHSLQPPATAHNPLHQLQHEYHQSLPPPQVDKLELERYLAAQAIANEYRALKPWELPIKDSYSDEPEHLYEKFDHYEYPDTHSMNKGGGNGNGSGGCGGNNIVTTTITTGAPGKPHIVYV